MKLFVSSAAVVMVLFSTQSALAAPGAEGNWTFPQVTSGPLVIDSVITIQANQVSLHSVCSIFGQTAAAQVSAPATVSESQITVLGHASQEISEGGVDCNASLEPSSMGYAVSADGRQLTLTVPGQGSLVLPRAN